MEINKKKIYKKKINSKRLNSKRQNSKRINGKKIKLLSAVLAAILLITACAAEEGQTAGNSTSHETAEAPASTQAKETAETSESIPTEETAETSESIPTEETAETSESPQAEETPEPAESSESAAIRYPDLTGLSTRAERAGETLPDTEALAFVQNLQAGWCLGNTLDAYDDGKTSPDDVSTETSWGNPAAAKELFAAVKEAGFDTVRIPVTWHGHVTLQGETAEGGSVQVSEAWLARVQEVVDDALASDLYVILNVHHDTNESFYYPDSAHYEQSASYLTGVWTAIGNRFQNYDEHLIFEAINEPRLVGTGYEWYFQESAEACRDSEDCINRLNQVFVDTVRSLGGGNEDRYLMVPGYGASAGGVLTDLFTLPEDTAADRLIVSVHAYIPYSFALQAPGESGSTDAFSADSPADTREITSMLDRLYDKFISEGIPVIIGEYGARDKGGNRQAQVDYYAFYTAYARRSGMVCCVWDNGVFDGEGERFGIFDRKKAEVVIEEIPEAISRGLEIFD